MAWAFELVGKGVWIVADADGAAISTHPTRDAAMAAARAEIAELRKRFSQDIAEGGQITRNVISPEGEKEPA